jgi:hypothetical protein
MIGIIYMIRSKTANDIYIGCTKQPLNIRRNKHIYDNKKPLRMKPIHKYINNNGGWSNYNFEIIEEKEYENLKSLRDTEKQFIQSYKDDNDYLLLNSRI